MSHTIFIGCVIFTTPKWHPMARSTTAMVIGRCLKNKKKPFQHPHCEQSNRISCWFVQMVRAASVRVYNMEICFGEHYFSISKTIWLFVSYFAIHKLIGCRIFFGTPTELKRHITISLWTEVESPFFKAQDARERDRLKWQGNGLWLSIQFQSSAITMCIAFSLLLWKRVSEWVSVYV